MEDDLVHVFAGGACQNTLDTLRYGGGAAVGYGVWLGAAALGPLTLAFGITVFATGAILYAAGAC